MWRRFCGEAAAGHQQGFHVEGPPPSPTLFRLAPKAGGPQVRGLGRVSPQAAELLLSSPLLEILSSELSLPPSFAVP